MSEKVINNILNINHGDNFQFISFQSVTNNSDDVESESYIENKLVNEYLETSTFDGGFSNLELQDLIETLYKHTNKRSINMFLDKYMNDLSYSQIAKKYKLNFPSSAKYIIEQVEKLCKKLIS